MSFFVPNLDNAINDDEYLRKWNVRTTEWENICKKQFQLVYFGKMSYESTENMPVHERDYFYGELVQQRQLERDQYDKSLNDK